MKSKTALLCIISSIFFSVNTASAGVTPLNEYEWDDLRIMQQEGKELLENSNEIDFNAPQGNLCQNLCEGYSETITECPAGTEMSSCKENGCSHMYKCVASDCAPGYDKNYKECEIEVQEDNYFCSKCKN